MAEKFRRSADFFRDASVAVSFEGRRLTPAEETELVQTISENSSLEVTCLIGKEEEDGGLYARAVETAYRRFTDRENTGRFYRGTLKRGQILESSGSVIIVGDARRMCDLIRERGRSGRPSWNGHQRWRRKGGKLYCSA